MRRTCTVGFGAVVSVSIAVLVTACVLPQWAGTQAVLLRSSTRALNDLVRESVAAIDDGVAEMYGSVEKIIKFECDNLVAMHYNLSGAPQHAELFPVLVAIMNRFPSCGGVALQDGNRSVVGAITPYSSGRTASQRVTIGYVAHAPAKAYTGYLLNGANGTIKMRLPLPQRPDWMEDGTSFFDRTMRDHLFGNGSAGSTGGPVWTNFCYCTLTLSYSSRYDYPCAGLRASFSDGKGPVLSSILGPLSLRERLVEVHDDADGIVVFLMNPTNRLIMAANVGWEYFEPYMSNDSVHTMCRPMYAFNFTHPVVRGSYARVLRRIAPAVMKKCSSTDTGATCVQENGIIGRALVDGKRYSVGYAHNVNAVTGLNFVTVILRPERAMRHALLASNLINAAVFAASIVATVVCTVALAYCLRPVSRITAAIYEDDLQFFLAPSTGNVVGARVDDGSNKGGNDGGRKRRGGDGEGRGNQPRKDVRMHVLEHDYDHDHDNGCSYIAAADGHASRVSNDNTGSIGSLGGSIDGNNVGNGTWPHRSNRVADELLALTADAKQTRNFIREIDLLSRVRCINRTLTRAFAVSTSHQFCSYVLANPARLKPHGSKIHTTLAIVDVHDFSGMSERTGDARNIATFLTHFFTTVERAVAPSGAAPALQLKRVGDAVIFAFNVPPLGLRDDEPELHAVRAACRVFRSAVPELNAAVRAMDSWPERPRRVSFSFAVNAGVVFAGCLGSCESNSFDMVGSSFNVLCRIQGLKVAPKGILPADKPYYITPLDPSVDLRTDNLVCAFPECVCNALPFNFLVDMADIALVECHPVVVRGIRATFKVFALVATDIPDETATDADADADEDEDADSDVGAVADAGATA
eukprot:TRINITY_DN10936_c0_g2_i1.p1 TRINITY_DN10936_c0_g2~~TRINITY_DN10936_c0_g2_i1.p1  ORF type:complete len:920 (-),score=196.04 TRINITY_DN10936_c0_g2_i1:118-2712(-)